MAEQTELHGLNVDDQPPHVTPHVWDARRDSDRRVLGCASRLHQGARSTTQAPQPDATLHKRRGPRVAFCPNPPVTRMPQLQLLRSPRHSVTAGPALRPCPAQLTPRRLAEVTCWTCDCTTQGDGSHAEDAHRLLGSPSIRTVRPESRNWCVKSTACETRSSLQALFVDSNHWERNLNFCPASVAPRSFRPPRRNHLRLPGSDGVDHPP